VHWIALLPLPPAELPDAPGQDEVLRLWSWRALQFTPRVAVADGVVVLEIAASERLFGGRRALLRLLFEQNEPHPSVEWSQGATSLIAIGRLLERLQARQHGAPGPAATPPAQLPLAALAAARAHLATLQRLGCRTWGDLRALPRAGWCGALATGCSTHSTKPSATSPSSTPGSRCPKPSTSRWSCPAHVENASALLFGARRLLALLHAWLQARRQGALVLRLGWQMDRRRNGPTDDHLLVRTAEPTLDMAHFERLLAEHLARTTLAAPAIALRLATVETAPLPGASASLLLEDRRQGDSLHQLVERLSARLGAAQVQRVEPRADHRPERMQAWSAAVDAPQLIANNDQKSLGSGQKVLKASKGKAPKPPAVAGSGAGAQDARSVAAQPAEALHPSQQTKPRAAGSKAASSTLQPDALYPTWLLATPQRLAVQRHRPLYQGPLTLLAGPQRIEAAWWEPDATGTAAAPAALRDYFVARSAQAGLLWIYRERLAQAGAQPGWFLHGLFA
jgi:protein ImuB